MSVGKLGLTELAFMRARTDVEAKCGCIYRYHWLDKRWFCARIAETNASSHAHDFFARLLTVDPLHVSAAHCMAALRGKR